MTYRVASTRNLYLYKDQNGELQLAFFTYPFTYETGNRERPYDMTHCDKCNGYHDLYYYVPELSKYLCEECFAKHRKNVIWYQEDMHAIFNQIIACVNNPEKYFGRIIRFTDQELDLIDKYFEAHSNHPPKINNFI